VGSALAAVRLALNLFVDGEHAPAGPGTAA
jgi:hypothetical protein